MSKLLLLIIINLNVIRLLDDIVDQATIIIYVIISGGTVIIIFSLVIPLFIRGTRNSVLKTDGPSFQHFSTLRIYNIFMAILFPFFVTAMFPFLQQNINRECKCREFYICVNLMLLTFNSNDAKNTCNW